MVDKIKLAIGVPSYGGKLLAEHMRMWIEVGGILMNSPERFQLIMHAHFDINPVDRARNMIVAKAMELGADWLFMVDADTWVEGYGEGKDHVDAGFQILRMISEAERADATIVSAPVYKRSLGTDRIRELAVYRRGSEPNAFMDPSGEDAPLDTVGNPRTMMPVSADALDCPLPGWTRVGNLHPVDAVGAACCALNLAKINEYDAWYRFTDKLSEDLELCRQVRVADGKIFVDRRVRTGHLSRAFPIYYNAEFFTVGDK